MAKFEVVGELALYSQEGGYADDACIVDDEHLSDLIKEHLVAQERADHWSDYKFGKVRIIIEQLE